MFFLYQYRYDSSHLIPSNAPEVFVFVKTFRFDMAISTIRPRSFSLRNFDPYDHYAACCDPLTIYCSYKSCPFSSSGAYDLHKAYLDGEVGATRDDWIPWVPIDPAVPLFHHKKHERIPATFLPKGKRTLIFIFFE